MKKCIIFQAVSLYCITLLFSTVSFGQNSEALEVIARAWDYMRGTTSVSTVQMTVHRPDWQRSSTIKAWTKGRDNSIFQIIAPKKDKGNGTLKIGREMWTYNPKINRVVKIPPSMMSQSWMGSDFSNNDLSKADSIINDYTHEVVETREKEGFKIYLIKSVPKPDAPVIWGMQMLKIREDGILIEQSFHDEDLEMVKIMTTSDIVGFDGRPFPRVWTMRSVSSYGDAPPEDEYTLLEYENLQFGVPLEAGRFKINALKKPMR